METNKKVLLVSIMVLISQLGFCFYNIWYSQYRLQAITRNQQNSYIKYLYSTDKNLDDLKNRLEKIKVINETAYKNILQVALKHRTEELLLLLSGVEGIEFMPEKEQQMMLKIIISRMKHIEGANITLNKKPKDKDAVSTKSFLVKKIAVTESPMSETMNILKKTGKEKPKSSKKEKNNLPKTTKTPEKIKAEKNNPLEKSRTGTSSSAKDSNNPPKKPKLGTPSPNKVTDNKTGKNNLPDKPKTGTLTPEKVTDTKLGKTHLPQKRKVGTPSQVEVKDKKNNVLTIPKRLGTHPCDIDQSLFNGRENVSYEECSMTLLESRFSENTLQGGRWFPKDCKPQQRIAIIVPYRDRDRHFKLLLNNLIPKLRRQMMDYTFFVVEQASAGTRFNRGMIRNIGFLEARKEAKYDCYIFNDVDTIIENDLNFYTCVPNSAYHIAVRIAKHKYRHLYKKLIGGILGFTEDFFLKTNGYSNFFFIWGGEDDVMYERVKAVGGAVKRPEFNVSHTTTAMHDRDPKFKERYSLLKENSRFWKKDGLNTIEYQKIVTEKRKLYTWIYVNINETKYIEMMKSYNAEWNRLHATTTTQVSTQTMTTTSTDDTK